MERAYYSPTREFQEKQKSTEAFRATLGFDFIFPKDPGDPRKIICIEINGSNSGIHGIQKNPKKAINQTHRTMAKIRMYINPEKNESINKFIKKFDEAISGQKQHSRNYIDRLHKKTRDLPLFAHAFINPKTIKDMACNKLAQHNIIPAHLRASLYEPNGDNKNASGLWILKPVNGMRGKDILIASHNEVDDVLRDFESYFMVQEFVYPSGADEAPEDLKDHPASMRFLTDFRVFENGAIQTVFESAYMRVSPVRTDLGPETDTFRQAHVVNLCRKALAVPASARELELARYASTEIIKYINSLYYSPIGKQHQRNY